MSWGGDVLPTITINRPVNDLTLAELSIGENLRGAIAIVRWPRSELPSKEDLVANAERYLWQRRPDARPLARPHGEPGCALYDFLIT
jgi:hypothetical protein